MTTIEVDRKVLAGAVASVQPVTARTKQAPLLGLVRLVPRGGRLTVEATDSTTWREVTVPAKADGAPVLIDPRSLGRLLRADKCPDVLIASAGDGVRVGLNGSSATFPTIDATDWPVCPESWETGDLVTLEPHLVDAIRRVAASASDEDRRPILTALCFEGTYLAATDSYRLAWMGPFRPMPRMLVEAGPLVAAITAAGRNPTMVVGPHSVMVCGKAAASVVRRIDGEYPQWRKLDRPNWNFVHKVTFDRLATVEALKRCEAFMGRGSNVPIRLDAGGGQLDLSAKDDAPGGWAETVGCKGRLPATLALNPTFLREGLKACRADRVTLQTQTLDRDSKGEGRLLAPVRIVEGAFTYLLCPVRI